MNNVTNLEQIRDKCNEIVTLLVLSRKEAGITQSFMAEWIGVSRKRLINFEKGNIIDIELMCIYADKLSIKICLTYEIE
jgi:DNA-binding XRE family transcriptional regulator